MIICKKCNKYIKIEDKNLNRELFDTDDYKMGQRCKECLPNEQDEAVKQKSHPQWGDITIDME